PSMTEVTGLHGGVFRLSLKEWSICAASWSKDHATSVSPAARAPVRRRRSMPTIVILTVAAMVAFARNSLLAPIAVADGAIDAASFTAIRLGAGALVLAALLAAQRGGSAVLRPAGNWPSAFALFAYALAISAAYLRLGAASGALILFTSVQGTMLAWGLA